jgi:hypothetical protein
MVVNLHSRNPGLFQERLVDLIRPESKDVAVWGDAARFADHFHTATASTLYHARADTMSRAWWPYPNLWRNRHAAPPLFAQVGSRPSGVY